MPTRGRGKPRGLRRDRDCRDCKLRGVKCDLNRPRCLPCQLEGLSCGGYPQRVVWINGSPCREQASISRRKTKACTPPRSEPVITQKHASRSIDEAAVPQVDIDRNSFINRLASFCHHIKRDAQIVQDQGGHLSKDGIRLVSIAHDFLQARMRCAATVRQNDGTAFESVEAAIHRLALIANLNEALPSADPYAIFPIAAFAVFEVCDGPFGQWQRHIYGAKVLLDHHCRNLSELERLAQEVPGLIDIVSGFVWFDVCGAIVRGSDDLVLDDWHREVLTNDFYRRLGCSADCFNLFIHIAKGQVPLDPIGSCARAMNQLCRVGSDISDWGRCVDINRCAAAIAILDRLIAAGSSEEVQTALHSAVDRICQIISSTSRHSEYYIHMGVPAYLAGTRATNSEHCHTIRNYWQSCSLAGNPRYPGGLEACEVVWKEKQLA